MARESAKRIANVRWAKRSLTALCVLTGLSACVQIAGIEEPTFGDPNGSAGASASGGMGGSGGSTGGSGGTGGSCTPGTKQTCYAGPVETANIGNCKAGTKTCLANGTSFGVCEGEIVPQIENCVSMGDEDCDALADLEDSECKCNGAGVSTPCDTGLLGVCATGVGICSADGRTVESCVQNTAASPENCATPADDDCDGTAGAACTGNPQWTFAPAGGSATPNDDSIYSVATTPDGGYVVAGVVDGTIAADGYSITAGKAYIAKLDANKAVVWEKKFAASIFAVFRSVAVDKDGNVIVTGSFSGTMTVGASMFTSNSTDIFVIKIDANGQPYWSKQISGAQTQDAFGVAVDSASNIFMTGSTDNVTDFGGGPFSTNSSDVFVASYDPTGNYRWSKLYVNTVNQIGKAITTTPAGDVVIIGDTTGSVDLGGGPIPGGGNQDFFVARYRGTDGNHQWSKLFGNAGTQLAHGVALGPDGNVLITGRFAGTIDWKSGTSINAIGINDVYVAKLNGATGDYLAHAQGGKGGTSAGTSIGTDAAGNVTVFGHFNGSIDFGGQSAASIAGTFDSFLVKLKSDDLKHVWTHAFGKAGNQFGWDVAVNNDGSAIVGGGFYTELEVPFMQVIMSTGGSDLFAVRTNP